VGRLGRVKVGSVMGGSEKFKEGRLNPKSNDKLRLIVGKLGSVNTGKVIGGILKLRLGSVNPKSKFNVRLIVGRLGRVRDGSVIGGIEKVGKLHGPDISVSSLHRCRDSRGGQRRGRSHSSRRPCDRTRGIQKGSGGGQSHSDRRGPSDKRRA